MGSPLAMAAMARVSWLPGCSALLLPLPLPLMKVESFGCCGVVVDLDGRRSGDVRTGIQQESEWPYSSHSRVHLPVMATSGKGRASRGRRRREKVSNAVRFTKVGYLMRNYLFFLANLH